MNECKNCKYFTGVYYNDGFCDLHFKTRQKDSVACGDYTAEFVPQPTEETDVLCQEQEAEVEQQEPIVTPIVTECTTDAAKPNMKFHANSLAARLTEEDILYLKQNYGILKLQQIAEHFSVTGKCICKTVGRLGIKKLPRGAISIEGRKSNLKGLQKHWETYRYFMAHKKEIEEYISKKHNNKV